MPDALEGLRIIDLSQMIAGPYCTQLLADLGADVIKVEDPATAPSRRVGRSPRVTGADGQPTTFSSWWLGTNRNKRAISIDLRTEAGRGVLADLVRLSDVLVENLGADARERLGIDERWAWSFNRGLIWGSLTGFGRAGPDKDREGWDILAQARGGLMSMTGYRDGPPMKTGVSVVDYISGLHLSTGILAALRHRDRTGEGQLVDIALLDCLVPCLDGFPMWHSIADVTPTRSGNDHPMKFPGYTLYDASDGLLAIGAPPGPLWKRVAATIGRPDLSDVPDPVNMDEWNAFFDRARPVVAEWVAARTRAEAGATLDAGGVPNEPVQDLAEIWTDKQLNARGMFYESDFAPIGRIRMVGSPLHLSETPVEYRRPPSTASEHTIEVLTDILGYDDGRIAQLVTDGALGA